MGIYVMKMKKGVETFTNNKVAAEGNATHYKQMFFFLFLLV